MSLFSTNLQPHALRPVFTGRSCWLAAGLLIIGPLLQAIEFTLEQAPDDNTQRVAAWVADPVRIELSMAAGLLAVPFLLATLGVMVALTFASSRRLASIAGALMSCAIVGLAAVHGYELAAFGLSSMGLTDAAVAVLAGDHLGVPGAVLFTLLLGGATLGTGCLAATVWRSPRVPRIAVGFMLAFAVFDVALGQGLVSHLLNLVGFAAIAFGVVTGYARGAQPAAVTSATAHLAAS